MTESFKQYFEGMIKGREASSWLKIAKQRTKTVKALLEYFSDKNFIFRPEQLNEIYQGLKSGLSKKEILVYANPIFDSSKMKSIKEGLELGIGIKKAKIFANNKLNYLQMRSILDWWEKGVTLNELEPYIDPKYNYKQLDVIGRALLGKIERMDLIANPNYSSEYMDVIRRAILKYDEYVIKYIKKYCHKAFSYEQLEHILYYACERKKEYTDRQIDFIANPKFDQFQMGIVAKGFRFGLSFEQMKIYTDTKLDYLQMEEINKALVGRNLSIEQIKTYINCNFNAKQLKCIFSGLSNGYKVDLYAKECYKSEQMSIILGAIKNNISKKKLNVILNPEITAKDMSLILKAFEIGVTVEELELACKSKYSEQTIQNLIQKHNNMNIESNIKELKDLLF